MRIADTDDRVEAILGAAEELFVARMKSVYMEAAFESGFVTMEDHQLADEEAGIALREFTDVIKAQFD